MLRDDSNILRPDAGADSGAPQRLPLDCLERLAPASPQARYAGGAGLDNSLRLKEDPGP
jgi:hypothetical protein